METGTLSFEISTSSPFTGKEINMAARVTFAVVCSVMVVCGVLGNCLLIAVIVSRFRRKRFVHDLFIANLALADVLSMGYWVIFFVLDLILGYHPIVNEAHCVVNGFIICILSIVSVTSLVSISLNRYLHVCHSHLYGRIFTLPRTVLCCCLTWSLGILVSLPPLFGHHDSDGGGGGAQGSFHYNPETHICSYSREKWTYPKVIVFIFSTLPMVLIGYCNLAIFRFWKAARISRAIRYPLFMAKEGREGGFVARWKARWRRGDVSFAQVNQGSETREDMRSHLEHSRGVPVTTVEESSEVCCANVDNEIEIQLQSLEHHDKSSEVCTNAGNGFKPSDCHVHQEESSEVCADVDNVHEVEVSQSLDHFDGTPQNSAHIDIIAEPSAHVAKGGDCIRHKVFEDDAETSIIQDKCREPPSATGIDSAFSFSTMQSTDSAESKPLHTLPSKLTQRKSQSGCRKHQVRSAMQNLRKSKRKEKARERAFVRSLFVVWILMLFSYIPYGICVLVSTYVIMPSEVVIVGMMLLFANNAVNWIVYGVMNPAFRKGYAMFWRRLLVACSCVGHERTEKVLNVSQSSMVMGSQRRRSTDNELNQSCTS